MSRKRNLSPFSEEDEAAPIALCSAFHEQRHHSSNASCAFCSAEKSLHPDISRILGFESIDDNHDPSTENPNVFQGVPASSTLVTQADLLNDEEAGQWSTAKVIPSSQSGMCTMHENKRPLFGRPAKKPLLTESDFEDDDDEEDERMLLEAVPYHSSSGVFHTELLYAIDAQKVVQPSIPPRSSWHALDNKHQAHSEMNIEAIHVAKSAAYENGNGYSQVAVPPPTPYPERRVKPEECYQEEPFQGLYLTESAVHSQVVAPPPPPYGIIRVPTEECYKEEPFKRLCVAESATYNNADLQVIIPPTTPYQTCRFVPEECYQDEPVKGLCVAESATYSNAYPKVVAPPPTSYPRRQVTPEECYQDEHSHNTKDKIVVGTLHHSNIHKRSLSVSSAAWTADGELLEEDESLNDLCFAESASNNAHPQLVLPTAYPWQRVATDECLQDEQNKDPKDKIIVGHHSKQHQRSVSASSADWTVDGELLKAVDEFVFEEDRSPRDNDVLMGRGGKSNKWPGNQWLLDQKKLFEDEYKNARKNEKMKISLGLVDAVHRRGGRFVAFHKQKELWYEVSNDTARKKCSQQMRDTHTKKKYEERRKKYPKRKKSRRKDDTTQRMDCDLVNDEYREVPIRLEVSRTAALSTNDHNQHPIQDAEEVSSVASSVNLDEDFILQSIILDECTFDDI